MKKLVAQKNTYENLLARIRAEIEQGRTRAREAVEKEKVLTYWNVGKHISEHLLAHKERANYGDGLFERLSDDLAIEKTLLHQSVKFFQTYPIVDARQQLAWTHYRTLIKIEDAQARKDLEKRIVKENLSSRDLQQIVRQERIPVSRLQEETKEVEESPILGAKLSVWRERLFSYTIVEPKYITKAAGSVVIDLGFYINVQTPQAKGFEPKDGQIVESVKIGEDFRLSLSDAKKKDLYTYVALVERVVDADTIWVNIDCGFRTWIRQKLRLRAIDAPELSTHRGQQAKRFVEERLGNVSRIVIKTHGSDKYDRYLVDVFYKKGKATAQSILSDGVYLNQELLDEGLARIM